MDKLEENQKYLIPPYPRPHPLRHTTATPDIFRMLRSHLGKFLHDLIP